MSKYTDNITFNIKKNNNTILIKQICIYGKR